MEISTQIENDTELEFHDVEIKEIVGKRWKEADSASEINEGLLGKLTVDKGEQPYGNEKGYILTENYAVYGDGRVILSYNLSPTNDKSIRRVPLRKIMSVSTYEPRFVGIGVMERFDESPTLKLVNIKPKPGF